MTKCTKGREPNNCRPAEIWGGEEQDELEAGPFSGLTTKKKKNPRGRGGGPQFFHVRG